MAVSYGGYSASRSREITSADIKVALISAPLAGSTNGSPILIVYTLESDAETTASVVQVEYATDGATYNTASASASNAFHEGTTNLSTAAGGASHTFAWSAGTDLSTAFSSTTLTVRVRASDGVAYSSWFTTSNFSIQLLPPAPVLVDPPSLFFDSDTTPDFEWLIPVDPGTDRISFNIQVDDDSSFASPAIDHNSVDHLGRFKSRVETAPTTKTRSTSQVYYYIRDLSVTATSSGTAVTYAALTDHHTESLLPSTLVNPTVMLLNKADRRCYIDPSTISTTGFSISKSSAGIDTNGLVDLLIMVGTVAQYEHFWVNITGLSAATTYTYGTAPFATDLLGATIPSSITNSIPIVVEGSDLGVYLSNSSDTGFTLTPYDFGIDSTATVRVCLAKTPSNSYIDDLYDITSFSNVSIDYSGNFDDGTNAGAAFPDYLPGQIVMGSETSDHPVYIPSTYADTLTAVKSGAGSSANGQMDFHMHSPYSGALNYWVDIPATGVSETFEGARAKYKTASTEAQSVGLLNWRVRAGNIT